MHQVFIASKLVANESKKDADLLIEHLLPPSKKPFWLQIGEPKSRSWLYKNALKKRPTAKPIENGKVSKQTHTEDVIGKEYVKNKLAQAIV